MYDRPPFIAFLLLALILGGVLAGALWLLGWMGAFVISATLLIGYNAHYVYDAFYAGEVTQAARNPFFRGLGDKPGEIPTWAKQLVKEEDAARHGQTPRRGREAWVVNSVLVTIAAVSYFLAG